MSEVLIQRVFYGALALLTLVLFGVGMVQAGAPGLAFGLFTALTLGGAIVCVWERSIVRSAFALMATFTGVAGFFILLESDFLALAQILIYVGAILALILFGVMLSPPDLEERSLKRALACFLLVGGGVGWVSLKVAATAHWAVAGAPGDGREESLIGSAERIGVGFLAIDQYVVAFELAAVVLTVALVAAVYIARRRRVDLEPRPGEVT